VFNSCVYFYDSPAAPLILIASLNLQHAVQMPVTCSLLNAIPRSLLTDYQQLLCRFCVQHSKPKLHCFDMLWSRWRTSSTTSCATSRRVSTLCICCGLSMFCGLDVEFQFIVQHAVEHQHVARLHKAGVGGSTPKNRPSINPARGSAECCKFPQLGPGQSPSRKRILGSKIASGDHVVGYFYMQRFLVAAYVPSSRRETNDKSSSC